MALSRAMIDKSAVRAIATVDRKKNEMAFLALAKEWDVELWSFTPEELESAGTKFAESPFVRKTVGVGNVCDVQPSWGCAGFTGNGRWMRKICLRSI